MRHLSFLVIVVTVLAVAACDNDEIVVDERPPDFRLNDLDGEAFSLSDTQGDVVLLNFFSPSCVACLQETPDLVQLHNTYSDSGLVILGIALQAQSVDELMAYRDEYEVPFRILIDDQGVGRYFGVSRTPTHYVIDREVGLHGPFEGAGTKEQLEDLVEPFL